MNDGTDTKVEQTNTDKHSYQSGGDTRIKIHKQTDKYMNGQVDRGTEQTNRNIDR